MNKAKKIYVGLDGNMLREQNSNVEAIEPAPIHGPLTIADMGWTNSGVYFILYDRGGKRYFMSDTQMRKYIMQRNIMLDGTFEYLQQGRIQSIGLEVS